MSLQIRRGPESGRSAIVPDAGELLYVTNTGRLYVGDGASAGGIPLKVDVADVLGLTAALGGKANAVHGHAMGDISGLADAIAGRAAADHQHDARYPRFDINNQGLNATQRGNARTNLGLGTSAVLDAPASGDAGASQVVLGNDSRLGAGTPPIALGNMIGTTGINMGGRREVLAHGLLTGNSTLSISGVPSGPAFLTLVVTQDNTGSRSLTVPNASQLNGGNGSLNPAAGSTSLITLFTADAGAHWLVAVADTRPLGYDPFYVNPLSNGPVHIPIWEPMTLALGDVLKRGTGTLAFAKALSATPTNFGPATGNTAFASGDVLRVTVTSYAGFLTFAIPRIA